MKHRGWSGSAVGALLALGSMGTGQAASLVVEKGAITAITGLEIEGRSYTLSFVDGSFDTLYPQGFSGYGTLAPQAVQAVAAASGLFAGAAGQQPGLTPSGCASANSCTILIPDHSSGKAPAAQVTFARELIHVPMKFRPGDTTLWPFAAASDTSMMPDMVYGILTPAAD